MNLKKTYLIIIFLALFIPILAHATPNQSQIHDYAQQLLDSCISSDVTSTNECLIKQFPLSKKEILTCKDYLKIGTCHEDNLNKYYISDNIGLLSSKVQSGEAFNNAFYAVNSSCTEVPGFWNFIDNKLCQIQTGVTKVVYWPGHFIWQIAQWCIGINVDVYGGNPEIASNDTTDSFHRLWAMSLYIAYTLIAFFLVYNFAQLMLHPENPFTIEESRENVVNLLFAAAFLTIFPFFLQIIIQLIQTSSISISTFFGVSEQEFIDVLYSTILLVTTIGGVALFFLWAVIGIFTIGLILVMAKYIFQGLLGFFTRFFLLKIQLATLPIGLIMYAFGSTRKFGRVNLKILMVNLFATLPFSLFFYMSIKLAQDVGVPIINTLFPLLILFVLSVVYMNIITKLFDQLFQMDVRDSIKAMWATSDWKNSHKTASTIHNTTTRTYTDATKTVDAEIHESGNLNGAEYTSVNKQTMSNIGFKARQKMFSLSNLGKGPTKIIKKL